MFELSSAASRGSPGGGSSIGNRSGGEPSVLSLVAADPRRPRGCRPPAGPLRRPRPRDDLAPRSDGLWEGFLAGRCCRSSEGEEAAVPRPAAPPPRRTPNPDILRNDLSQMVSLSGDGRLRKEDRVWAASQKCAGVSASCLSDGRTDGEDEL